MGQRVRLSAMTQSQNAQRGVMDVSVAPGACNGMSNAATRWFGFTPKCQTRNPKTKNWKPNPRTRFRHPLVLRTTLEQPLAPKPCTTNPTP